MPKFSIIVISHNNENNIEDTIKSVQNQTFKDFEFILADENSTDKTLEIAGQYKSFIKKWISEPSKSVYDSMNKGILLAQGEYILFLISGDILADDNVLEKFSNQLDDSDIICGDIKFHNKKKEKYTLWKQNKFDKTSLLINPVYNQGIFFARNLLENMGGFDARFKTSAEYELFLRAITRDRAKTKYVSKLITITDENKRQIFNAKYLKRSIKEKEIIRKTYIPSILILINKFLRKI